MSKIQDIIAEKKIKPSDCDYHTNRSLEGGKGSIRVLAFGGMAHSEYKCPKCGFSGYQETEWKKPFGIKCEKCKASIRVPKMKNQAKREMKKDA